MSALLYGKNFTKFPHCCSNKTQGQWRGEKGGITVIHYLEKNELLSCSNRKMVFSTDSGSTSWNTPTPLTDYKQALMDSSLLFLLCGQAQMDRSCIISFIENRQHKVNKILTWCLLIMVHPYCSKMPDFSLLQNMTINQVWNWANEHIKTINNENSCAFQMKG